ncbi:hypothetical protein KJ866_04475 [Patescibacteria group bacterium]|nr:hypothetical protein [Patescibacteria group bacterium]
MKTGEKNFVQRFGIVSKKEKTSRYQQHFSSEHLREMFPAPFSELSELSEDRSFLVADVPLLAATVGIFIDKVKTGLKDKKMPYGITDLTEMPFRSGVGGFLYLVFVIDGKIVVMRGDLVDINLFDDNDIVIGLVKLVVFWGPRKESQKLFDALNQFVAEAGFDRIKKEASKMLMKNKQVAKYLPPVFKKFYGE